MWTAERIESVVSARASEGAQLEFKSELPERSDQAKSEFLKDVVGFANSDGGTILYGISERAGQAEALSGLVIADVDLEVRRLTQVAESGIEPRIAGMKFTAHALDSGQVLIIEIPQSFDAPHRLTVSGKSRFVKRSGALVSDMSYDEIRTAFTLSASRAERLRKRWIETSNDLHKPLISGPAVIMKLAPVVSSSNRQLIDPRAAYNGWERMIFPGWGGGSPDFNFEGLYVGPGRREIDTPAGVQIHRDGSVTCYRTARRLVDDLAMIPSSVVAGFLVEAFDKARRFILDHEIGGAALLFTRLERLQGFTFGVTDQHGYSSQLESRKPTLELPETFVEDLSADLDGNDVVRPHLDMIWQSYGLAEYGVGPD